MYRNGDPQRTCLDIGYGAGYGHEGSKREKHRVGEHRIGRWIYGHGINGMPGDKHCDTKEGIEQQKSVRNSS
jgi:hypothetical protein